MAAPMPVPPPVTITTRPSGTPVHPSVLIHNELPIVGGRSAGPLAAEAPTLNLADFFRRERVGL
ncbi:hypothetical protein GCM10022284_33700 [Streptomyces hundungensis]